MKRLPRKFADRSWRFQCRIATLALASHASFAGQSSVDAAKMRRRWNRFPPLTPFAEAHAHFDRKKIPSGAIRSALAALGRENAAMIFF